MNKFCTNCGHPVKPTDNVCGNCGQPIHSISKKTPTPVTTNKPKKKLSKRKKIFCGIAIVVIILLGAGVIGGFNYYSKENQVTRIVNALTDGSPSLKKYVITDSKKVKITTKTLKPFQNHYQYYTKSEKRAVKNGFLYSLKHPNSKGTVQLVRNGNYFMIFPKYSLKIRTYSPVINTDDDQDTLRINGTYMGKIKSNSKKKVNLLPGTYNIRIYDKNKQATYKTVEVTNNDPIFIDVKTYSIKIKGPAYSKVYFNGVHKKVEVLDKNGEGFSTFFVTDNSTDNSAAKQSDPDKIGEFYLTTTVDGKTVKSKPIKDFIGQLADFNTYGANSDSGVIKWSDSDDYDYVVTPKWDADVDIKN